MFLTSLLRYVLAAKPEEYVLVYYRGENDAWVGYGGAVVYTRDPVFPKKYAKDMDVALQKVGLKFADFTLTDNSCRAAESKIDPPGTIAAILPPFDSTAWSSTNTPLSASNSRTWSNSTGALASGLRKRWAMSRTALAVSTSCKSFIAFRLCS